MNCFSHLQTPSVATCKKCGRGLCNPCSFRYIKIEKNPICHICFHHTRELILQSSQKDVRDVLLLGPILAILLMMAYSYYMPSHELKSIFFDIRTSPMYILLIVFLVLSYQCVSFFATWKMLNRVNGIPRFFIAMYASLFLAPFWFWKKYKIIRKLKGLANR